ASIQRRWPNAALAAARRSSIIRFCGSGGGGTGGVLEVGCLTASGAFFGGVGPGVGSAGGATGSCGSGNRPLGFRPGSLGEGGGRAGGPEGLPRWAMSLGAVLVGGTGFGTGSGFRANARMASAASAAAPPAIRTLGLKFLIA